jgi:hypothetical protein
MKDNNKMYLEVLKEFEVKYSEEYKKMSENFARVSQNQSLTTQATCK